MSDPIEPSDEEIERLQRELDGNPEPGEAMRRLALNTIVAAAKAGKTGAIQWLDRRLPDWRHRYP